MRDCPSGCGTAKPKPRLQAQIVNLVHNTVDIIAQITVSIHAPAWGATLLPPLRCLLRWCFDPRPRMGGDNVSNSTGNVTVRFDPRPRMGGDEVTL